MLQLPASTTALILIDLQKGVVGLPLEPYDGDTVLAQGKVLAERFRAAGSPVVLVNVGFAPDFGDALKAPVDRKQKAAEGGMPNDWMELCEGLSQPSDLLITKHQWGAFYGTELDLQLRRRGVKTVVIGGISTNIGVESTARSAHEYGYEVVLVEDATASHSAAMHAFAYDNILPLLSRVTRTDDIELQR